MTTLILRSSHCAAPRRRVGLFGTACLVVALLGAALGSPAQAQPLSRFVSLNNPTAGVSNRLDVLRHGGTPRVALLFSEQTAEVVPGGRRVVEEAAYQWELFLLGLQMPYRTIDDRDLARGLDRDVRLLILPATAALSQKQRQRIRDFTARGGGVIASGRTGFYDERGRRVADTAFLELFDAELVNGLPPEPAGIFQTIDGGHALTDGLPMGYCLNLAPQVPMVAARPMGSVSAGRPFTYTHKEDAAFADVSFLLYGTRGNGRYVWARFNPQDVSRDAEHQAVYQGLMINAMAYAANIPSVALRPWPAGAPSAMVMTALPAVGYDTTWYPNGVNLLLDLLDTYDAPGTFFLATREAAAFPNLLRRIRDRGELAISADSDVLLATQPVETQTRRLTSALSTFGLTGTAVSGLYPPGGMYDGGTLRAANEAGVGYVLLPKLVSFSPGRLNYEGRIDFLESINYSRVVEERTALQACIEECMARRDVGTTVAGRTVVGRTTDLRPNRRVVPTATATETITPLMTSRIFAMPLLGEISEGYFEDFDLLHRAGGLYVVRYYPEIQFRAPADIAQLSGLLQLARNENVWITSLRDVHDWWVQKEQISVRLTNASPDALTFEVINNGPADVRDVSLDVRLDAPVGAFMTLSGGEATATASPDGRTLTLVLPTLRTGTNRFTLSLE